MKIRKYFAADMRQALNLARQEQGPDVVILGNKKVLGGIELIAAEDYEEALFFENEMAKNLTKKTVVRDKPQQKTKSEQSTDQPPGQFVDEQVDDINQPQVIQPDRGLLYSNESNLELMQQEINSLRKLLEQQMSGLAWGDVGRRHPLWTSLSRKLGHMGISPAIANEVVKQVPEDYHFEQAWRTSLALLSYRIPVLRDNILTEDSVIALAGPSGSGKTTMMAKLAANFVLENSASKVVMATLDSYRVGGREQLSSYAKILGVPLRTIHNKRDLSELLDQFYGKKLILIDTAGLSPRDMQRKQQTDILISAKVPVKLALVLSATSQVVTLKEIIDTHRMMEPQMCMLTKLDESSALGEVLSVIISEGLSIAYQSNGQRVPDDLANGDATDLISRAITMMKRYEKDIDETSIEQKFGRHAIFNPLGEQHA